MTKKLLMTAAVVAGYGIFVLTGRPAPPAVFTVAQAAAGKAAYENSCAKCHTATMMGRKGEAGELPPLSSLPAAMQEVVQANGGMVPPLAGPDFLSRWGARTTQDLSRRVREAVGGFPPAGANEETYLQLTAYFLQVNGARAGQQALTMSTAVEIRSVATGAAPATPATTDDGEPAPVPVKD